MLVFQNAHPRVYLHQEDKLRNLYPTLAPGIYALMQDERIGYFLEEMPAFRAPSKLYGDTSFRAQRILEVYNSPSRQGKNLGVLLSGSKGSGKTLLAQKICLDSGLPVILINKAYSGDEFMLVMAGLPDCVVLFDEFEKTYREEADQEAVLTFFAGVGSHQHKLLIATVNDRLSIADYFHNRPGRFFFAIQYEGVAPEFIEEYCEDNLGDKTRTPEIQKVAVGCTEFNFDMLQALVEYINAYPLDKIEKVVEMLNVKPYGFGQKKRWVFTAIPLEKGNQKVVFTIDDTCSESPLVKMGSDDDGEMCLRWEASGPSDGKRKDREQLSDTGHFSISLSELKSATPTTFEFHTKVRGASCWDFDVRVLCTLEESSQAFRWGGALTQRE